MRILGASIGNCVHVGGIVNFLKLAEKHGYETGFLGPATPVRKVVEEVSRWRPGVVALSYRLTPETGRSVLLEVKAAKEAGGFESVRLVFGGTPEVAKIASELGIFDWVVTGLESPQEIEAWLTGQIASAPAEAYPATLLERIAHARPMPILRHHFGQPTLEATIKGCREIAEAHAVDVISIAPDQNAQEFFFRPGEMRPELTGAGGVPLRRPEDLRALYEAMRKPSAPPVLRRDTRPREVGRDAEGDDSDIVGRRPPLLVQ